MPHSPSASFPVLGALAIALASASCTQSNPANDANQAQQADPVAPEPAEESSLAETALDREQFLVTMLDAASAAIVGSDDSAAQQALKGRRFEVRMRFGCAGGQPIADRSWSHNESSGSLKVTVKPDVDREIEGTAPADGGAEAPVFHDRGFLVPSPTVLANGCPVADYSAAAGFTNLRFGIVQRTDSNAPRASQLLDSYEIVKKIAPEAIPAEGLDLILRGRLETPDGSRAIRCEPRGGIVECLASATIDQVSVEDPASQQLIAEWGGR